MSKIKSTTQEHLDIADIKNNTVILKNGGACYILETTAINFDLLSMIEQDSAIAAYSSLLNSLSFPIQVSIKSKRMDITEYLEKIKEIERKQTNKKIKYQLKAYRNFIQGDLITKENVLDKKFFVSIPYGNFSLLQATPLGWIGNLMGSKSKKKSRINIDNILQEATADLAPKRNFLIKELARIGIKAKQLKTHELIKLFYEIYNSETSAHQRMSGVDKEYTSPLVEPKIAQ